MAFDQIQAPAGLDTHEFVLRPIAEANVELDYEAVMETKDFLREWESPDYPADDFTVEDNRADIMKMAARFADRHSFSYTMTTPDATECLGCVYIFPTDVSWMSKTEVTELGDTKWSETAATVQFWVRTSRLADGLDRRLFDALRPWIETAWPFDGCAYVTSESLTQQVALFEHAGLRPAFRLLEPDESAQVAYV